MLCFHNARRRNYATMILKILANVKYNVVFKGGTSLSKAFGVIDRFSEDIDITFMEHLGASRRKRLKYEILKPIEETLHMELRNWNSIESDRDYNHYDYYYESVFDNSMGGLPPFPMSVQAIERTMVDKIFALCDYYMLDRAHRNSWHLYDVYKLSSFVKVMKR